MTRIYFSEESIYYSAKNILISVGMPTWCPVNTHFITTFQKKEKLRGMRQLFVH